MIIGIGIDTVSISRIEKLIQNRGERFLKKVFTDQEISEGAKQRNNARFFAARFAAREAFFKALGTGWGRGLSLKEVGVATSKQGQPKFSLSGRIEQTLRLNGINKSHLSITHEGDTAHAIAVLEKI
jgi:holo-[acyl-carrier protein] synthase